MREELVSFLEELKHNISIPDTETVRLDYIIERVEGILEEGE